jgi:hypothetical protein
MKSSPLLAKIGVFLVPSALIVFPSAPSVAFNQFDVCVKQMVGSGVSAEKAGTACADALIPKELSRCVVMIRSQTAVNPDDALTACYRVRRPVDLAHCVIDIDNELLKSKAAPVTPQETTPPPTSPDKPVTPETPVTPEGENNFIEGENQSKEGIKPSKIIAQASETQNQPNLTQQSEFIPDENSSPLLVALDSCRRSLLPSRYSQCVTGLSRQASLSAVAAMNTCLDVQAYPTDIFPSYNPQ